MADFPLLGVPAASSPPPPVPEPTPTFSTPARWTLIVLTGAALLLLAWRGYGLSRYSTRPASIRSNAVPLSPMDLNRASAAELASIPGLGEKLGARIALHREDRGEFRSVEELRGVSGIGPKTLERIRPFLQVSPLADEEPPPMQPVMNVAAGQPRSKKPLPASKIDVNRASLDELQKLPGIGPALAGRIVEKRAERPFGSVEDLRKVKGIGVKTLDKLRPHVSVGDE